MDKYPAAIQLKKFQDIKRQLDDSFRTRKVSIHEQVDRGFAVLASDSCQAVGSANS
jgi:hypothetical protein